MLHWKHGSRVTFWEKFIDEPLGKVCHFHIKYSVLFHLDLYYCLKYLHYWTWPVLLHQRPALFHLDLYHCIKDLHYCIWTSVLLNQRPVLLLQEPVLLHQRPAPLLLYLDLYYWNRVLHYCIQTFMNLLLTIQAQSTKWKSHKKIKSQSFA